MKSRPLFRESGYPIATRRSGIVHALLRTLWIPCALAALVAIFGYAGWLDQRAEQQQLQAALQHQVDLARAYDEGVRKGNAEMMDTARAAWEAAQAEADQCRANRGRL